MTTPLKPLDQVEVVLLDRLEASFEFQFPRLVALDCFCSWFSYVGVVGIMLPVVLGLSESSNATGLFPRLESFIVFREYCPSSEFLADWSRQCVKGRVITRRKMHLCSRFHWRGVFRSLVTFVNVYFLKCLFLSLYVRCTEVKISLERSNKIVGADLNDAKTQRRQLVKGKVKCGLTSRQFKVKNRVEHKITSLIFSPLAM